MLADAPLSASADARRAKRVGILSLAGLRLLVVPFLSLRDRSDAVLIADIEVEELPAIYARIDSTFTAWSEIIDELPELVLTARPNGNVDYWNRGWREYTGRSREPSLARVLEFIVADDANEFVHTWRAGIAHAQEFTTELRLRSAGGDVRWHRLHAKPILREGRRLIKWLVCLTDVHELRLTNERLERSERRLRFLAGAHSALASSLDAASVAEAACRYASEALGGPAAILLRDHPSQVFASPQDAMSRMMLRARNGAVETQADIASFVDPDSRYAIVPLPVRNDVVGWLCVSLAEEKLGSDDFPVVEEFARNIGLAIENARVYESERRIAGTFQRYLLPSQLEQPHGVRIEGSYSPRDDETMVGGDWYDAFLLRDGSLALTIGDVGGSGVQAATLMGALRQSIRTALLSGVPPGAALQLANYVVYGAEPDYATAWIAVVDLIEMTMRYASAGHPAPIVIADSCAQFIDGPIGQPLGTDEWPEMRDRTTQLSRSSALVLYSDGMIEYDHNIIDGLERLRAVSEDWGRTGMQVNAETFAANVFGANPRRDDAALLLVRFDPIRELDVTVKAIRSQSPVARRILMRFVREWEVEDRRASDIILASSEALNNAIEHAYGRFGGGKVRLRASHENATIVVQVDDDGHWREQGPEGERGRGILLMSTLTDDVEIRRDPGGTSVRLVFDLTKAPRAGSARWSELSESARH